MVVWCGGVVWCGEVCSVCVVVWWGDGINSTAE